MQRKPNQKNCQAHMAKGVLDTFDVRIWHMGHQIFVCWEFDRLYMGQHQSSQYYN